MKNAFGTILFSEARIRSAIRRLARRIDRDYAPGDPPVMVGILKGGAFFLVHLAQELTIPAEVEFVQAASYGQALRSSGRVRKGLETGFNPKGRHILLVDDILDSGRTLRRFHEDFVRRGASSVRSVVLFDKTAARTVAYEADYAGLVTPDVWLTGFGLDYKGLYRGCRFAGVLKDTG
jgi:hypoxanthine phosphoribosyltransferase